MTSVQFLSQLPTKFAGLRYIAFKSQVLLSSGIISLDSILGGGIPLGTILLIEEDEYGVFSEIFMRYFYAEGLACKHRLCIVSPDCQTSKIIHRIPQIVKSDEIQPEGETTEDFKMKIAWRYEKEAEVCSKPSRTAVPPNFGHNFDLSHNVPPEEIEKSGIIQFPNSVESDFSYEKLLYNINESVNDKSKSGPIRIGIHSVGSPSWPFDLNQLTSFLYALRCIIYNNPCSIAVVTLPVGLLKNNKIIKRCEDVCDIVLTLESLINNSNPLYSDYKALVKVLKFSSINSLSPYRPEATDWALKLHRRKCLIEKLHIAPEVESPNKENKQKIDKAPLCHRPVGNIDF